MSLRSDGKFRCDSCGVEMGNGGVLESTVVSDLDPHEPGRVRNLGFCRDREEDGKLIKGCSRKILRPSVLTDYEENRGQNDAGDA